VALGGRLRQGAQRSVFVATLLTSSLFHASAAETRLSGLASHVRGADVIAKGVITRNVSRCPDEFRAPRPGSFATEYTFVVSAVLKGCALPGDSMAVRTLGGGPCDGEEEIVFEVPRFSAGDSLVLFMRGDPGGPKWPIWRDSWQPYPGYATLKGGVAWMPGTTDVPDPIPFDQLEHRVREVIHQQAHWPQADSGLKGAIVGAVGDSTEQVADARVTVDGRSAVPCDARGTFQLPNLPAGCVRLLFEADGHRAEPQGPARVAGMDRDAPRSASANGPRRTLRSQRPRTPTPGASRRPPPRPS